MKKPGIIFKIGKIIVPIIYKILFRLKINNRENILKDGPFIIASNHYSNWDPLMVGVAFLPVPIKYMAKKELFKNKIIGSILRDGGGFPVDRNIMRASTLKEVEAVFNSKGVIAMFPQGTRTKNKDASKIRPKKGTAYLSIKYKIPVIPVFIDWPDTPSKVFFKRKKVNLYIKEAMYPPEELNDENIEKFTKEIYENIIGK